MWLACCYLRQKLPKIIVREITLFADPLIVNKTDNPELLNYARGRGFLTINLNLALNEAAKKNHLRKINYLIDQGANVNYSMSQALRICFDNNHLDAFKLIHQRGANIYSLNKYAFVCIYGKPFEIFEYLLKVDANEVFNNILSCEYDIIDEFLQKYPLFKNSFLIKATVNNKVEFLEKFHSSENLEDSTLLHEAFNASAGNSIKYLIDIGADINVNGDAPLNDFIKFGRFDMVEFLLQNKINIKSLNFDWIVNKYSHSDIFNYIELLFKYNVDIDLISDKSIVDILRNQLIRTHEIKKYHVFIAVVYGNFETFKLLYDKCIDDFHEGDMYTLLDHAGHKVKDFKKFAFIFSNYLLLFENNWDVRDLFEVYNKNSQIFIPAPPTLLG